MADHRPDIQPPRLDPLVAGPPRFGAGARTLVVAGMVGACAMGAVAGTWARPEVGDLKQAKEVRSQAPQATVARPVLRIVDADLMPPPAERLEVLPAWVEVPIPPVVEPGPLRKVLLQEPVPAPVAPPPEPKPKADTEAKMVASKANKAQPEPEAKPKPVKAKAAPRDKAKSQEARAEPKPVKATTEDRKADKPRLQKVKLEKLKAEKSAKAQTAKPKAKAPRLLEAKLDKPASKATDKKAPMAEPAEAKPSKLRVALAKLKPAKQVPPKEGAVAAAPAKPNKIEKVQKELAALSALPVAGKKKVAVAETKPKTVAPEQSGCQARSRAEALLCEDPQLAAADRRLARAYRQAAEAGAPEWRLRRQQTRWLAARERAADQEPWAVAEVYDARIAELEDEAALAREAF